VYNGNYLNGALITFTGNTSKDYNAWATDNGPISIGADGNESTVDINGVQYEAFTLFTPATDNNGLTLTVDGNCSYTGTTGGADFLAINGVTTPHQQGTTSKTIQTVYFDDDNTSRKPGWATIDFADSGVLTDTYKYRQYYSTSEDAVYLLLDATTGFSNDFTNADLNFRATDVSEYGSPGVDPFADGPPSIYARAYLPYYWPDTDSFGNDAGDTAYMVAAFAVQADSTTATWDFLVHVDTSTDELVQYPNNDLSNYTTDVNCVAASNPLWDLKARTDVDSALHAGFLEYGTKAELTDDMTTATFTVPEAQVYLKLSVLGEGATTTVEGGETQDGVKEGQTVTIAGKDITVSKINYTAGACTVEGSTYPRIVPVGQLVYTDSPAPAGNHVIVGGYLVNRLAENVVLGDGSTLQEALTAPGDKVAEVLSSGDIIVAGFTASDTKSAAQELIAALDALS